MRPSVLTAADSIAAQHLESEKTLLDHVAKSLTPSSSFEVQTADVVAGTKDYPNEADKPMGSGRSAAQLHLDPSSRNKDYNPLDYDYEDEWEAVWLGD